MTLDPAQQAQILTPAVRRLMSVLHEAGEVRVVGGAVRDVIVGRKVEDIDLATTLPPQRVMELLAQQGIKTAPTGLAHGTITAVVDHMGYEITTLRRDVETDGRHAQVVFTDDWREDAARRDFTFNALYVDADGHLYDYFGGIGDAQAGRVCFIGDARARIREDVLRILRFFRFYAWFGIGDADVEALAACRELADLIPRLSAERVANEVKKLLSAPHPFAAWRLMYDEGVLAYVLPEAEDFSRLQGLLGNEITFNEPAAALTRLAALLPQDERSTETVARRLKLSNRDSETLRMLARLPVLLETMPLRYALYLYGVEACRAAIFLNGKNIALSLAQIVAWDNPVFPIKGEDIIAAGIPAGPRVGEILRAVEQWWIAGDFHASRAVCLEYAHQYGKNL